MYSIVIIKIKSRLNIGRKKIFTHATGNISHLAVGNINLIIQTARNASKHVDMPISGLTMHISTLPYQEVGQYYIFL